jgi:DnaJ-class molecular chaperone
MAEDYYKTLGIERTANSDEIAKSYRQLARKYHPDLNPDDAKAKNRFQRIQAAYDTLSDPEKRKLYDQYGDDYEKYRGQPFGQDPFGRSSPGSGFDFRDAFNSESGFEFQDFFRPGGKGAGGRSSRSRSRRNHDQVESAFSADVAAEIPVPLRIMLDGGEVQFKLNRGNGRIEDLRVKIPADISPGKKVRLRGMGDLLPDGSKGDLILTVQLQPHPSIKIQGDNIELKLPVTLGEAIHGTRVDIPTRSGTVTLKIPSMSDSGKRLRVKGQGLRGENDSRGDLIVELQIHLPEEIPEKLGDDLKAFDTYYSRSFRDSIQW